MVAAGILGEDDRFELITGELVEMPPQGPIHSVVKDRLRRRLEAAYGPARFVRDQVPLACGPDSLPEPDISVCTVERLDRHPEGREALLVVEVAYTSQVIDRAKAPVYAAAGVEVYWLVNVPERRLEVYERPSAAGYHRVTVLDDTLDVDVPGLAARWRVADLLP